MKGCRAFTAIMLILTPTLAAHAAELFTPGLPATGAQFLECRIINVTAFAQTVTSQAFDSTGAPATGPVTQTLAPGEAGGFSVSAAVGSVYCKFTVEGPGDGFRASIDVLNTSVTPPVIAVALPAQ